MQPTSNTLATAAVAADPATTPTPADAPTARRISLSQIRVHTNPYILAHGHAPRGRARWAFYFDPKQEPWWAPGTLRYSDARRKALAEAQRRGVDSITVAT